MLPSSYLFFFFQAEDGIRDAQESRGLGDVYKRQLCGSLGGSGVHADVRLPEESHGRLLIESRGNIQWSPLVVVSTRIIATSYTLTSHLGKYSVADKMVCDEGLPSNKATPRCLSLIHI
eukprot:TRINITY_DN26439_c0_g1_i2.p1 TRINITY_DN26439_c0_g1~~TRINITY_DN26439_c0_g1_i2.p1  ORF type:complete len:119 (+),score=24.74 TRINITY_DN26439_c0_g1_i2:110-466(+)